ncbi:AraC family transcriptional regulator [Paenibacillus sp. HWE-109]|uniref:helix-turn-helix transcriptional regulator n=1 Tax=Paenibacillus sp. HWE-109 TaxID=1306526 RepID=UPI001EDD8A6A|nr:AraC family transcriptional regulator [Paenibacillus sp. HWE-109]UKS29301.1 AraC family transcriptional regulator [Paenibacillus sp. HWE-109]
MLCLELTMPPLPQFVTIGRARWEQGMQHFRRTFDVYDMLFCTSGAFYMSEDEQSYEVLAGHMLVLEAGKEHWGYRPTEVNSDIYWVHFVHERPNRTLFHEEIEWTSVIKKGTDTDITPSKQTMYIPKYTSLDLAPIIPILEEMYALHNQFQVENALELHALLGLLFSKLQKSIRNRHTSRSQTICDRVMQYLQARRHEPYKASEMERELHFNPDYLNRCLKKHAGMTPVEYLHYLRIEDAKLLLTGTALPVEHIAEQIGFPNSNYFVRLFHRKVGMTPGRFRKMCQGYM